MITLDHVSKSYRTHQGRRCILDDVSVQFPRGRNIGVLGTNGAGKSTLIRLLSGAELPDTGRVRRSVSVSFPMAFGGTFNAHLSGRENVVFLARLYGMDVRETIRFVRDFVEIGEYFDMPLHTYSSGMRARLVFAASLAIDFDVYLVDEITEVGDARFRDKAAKAFRDRIQHSNLILVSHNHHTIRDLCDVGAVLGRGKLTLYDDLQDAFQAYEALRKAI
jgi:capsular polysaccharide transport system ATP-binding protein